MSDPIAASRLPDLPTAGYATRAQRELTDAIMFLIRGMERDRPLLLETVLKGRELWRKRFVAAYRAIKADSDMADVVFGYLVLLAGPNVEAQKARLEQLQVFQGRQRWDRRLCALLDFTKDRRELDGEIQRQLLRSRARRVYSR